MKKLLFLGIDTSTSDALAYAKSKGVYTIIADYLERTSSPLKAEADECWKIDVKRLDELETQCRNQNISGIYAGSHELCLDNCKILCERLDLPFYASEEGWRASRDKELYKTYCRKVGLDVPKIYWIGGNPLKETFDSINFPVVVKPIDSTAKKGFTIVACREELRPAIEYALAFSQKKRIIVEDYIDGDLVNVFGCIRNGKLKLVDIMINLSDETNGKKTFCFGIHESRHNVDIIERLLPAYEKMIQEMNCEQGPVFFQSILRGQTYYQLEMGYRLDGVCSWKHIERLKGINQLKFRMDLALNEATDDSLSEPVIKAENEICISIVYWGKAGRISSIKGKQNLYDRSDVIVQWDRFREGDIIPDTGDMTGLVLFIELFGKSHYEIDKKMKKINQTLHYYNETGEDLLLYHDGLYEKWEALQKYET